MDIDKPLNDAAADKIRDYRADDSNHHSISSMGRPIGNVRIFAASGPLDSTAARNVQLCT